MTGRVLSVCGKNRERVLLELTAAEARELVGEGALAEARPSRVIDALERELDRIRERDEQLADSALAASAVAMAYEIEHPYNSATSKSMCQARLAEAMQTLRELMPPERKKDSIDELKEKRAKRLAVG